MRSSPLPSDWKSNPFSSDLGLREMVSERLGKSHVDAIIGEEKSHIVVLSRERRLMRSQL